MANTSAYDVFDSFEASFRDKQVISDDLELVWLLKAIGRYSVELDELTFDQDALEFDCELNRYAIDTLAAFMKQSYQEREVSRVNKRVSIVGRDLSIDGSNGQKTASKAELDYDTSKSNEMINNVLPTAYV